jgi:hypothetical protein
MIYDAWEYEKQLRKIRKSVRRNASGLDSGEYLYGFRKTDRIKPVVTFLLYAGEKPWDTPKDLWDMLDFTDIPEQLMEKIQNYHVNVVDIRRLEDTTVFHTDIRDVFDFIRCSDDKKRLKELVNGREYFKHMEKDAFDIALNYSHAEELGFAKEKYEDGGKVNMCVAIQEMLADSRNEGIEYGIEQGIEQGKIIIINNMLKAAMPDEKICEIAECTQETIDNIRKNNRENNIKSKWRNKIFRNK